MRPKALRQRRPDASHPVERVHRAERTEPLSLLDDPGRERRADARESIQLLDGRHIDVDRAYGQRSALCGPDRPARTWSACRGRFHIRCRVPCGAPLRERGSTSPSTRDRGVDTSELRGERGVRACISWRAVERDVRANADPEGGDRGDEEQGLSFGGRRHARTMARRAP
jgi:hypothetical protein